MPLDLRVIVAADSALLRAGLSRLLEDEGLRVVARAASAAEVVRDARVHRPDVIVLSLARAPRRDELPVDTGVLALAQHRHARSAMALLEAGPAGVGLLVGRRSRRDVLTAREREVLELMAQGRSNRAIAGTVFLSERGVERHITAIFDKLRLP